MTAGSAQLSGPEDTFEAGRRLAGELRAGDVLILTGPLGAGKTTFSRGLGEGLQVRGPITSPTFVLARRHPSLVGGPALLHVDAYRISNADELWDLDLDLEDAVTVVEWGRGLAEQLAPEVLEVELTRPSEMTGEGGADDYEELRIVRWRESPPRWTRSKLQTVLDPRRWGPA